MNFKGLIIAVLAVMTLTSCSYRLVDFTVISSKNMNLEVDRSLGVATEGKKSYFLGLGWNIKDALDEALEKAGPEYDLLIDGVVRYGSYPFVATVTVEGTAVSSKQMKESMGVANYENWLKEQKVVSEKTAVVVEE